MKVLYLTSWYPTKQKTAGTVFVREHVRAIKNSGVDITVLFINISESKSIINTSVEYFKDENDTPIIQINILSRFYKKIYQLTPFLYLKVNREVNKLLKEKEEFDLIHANVISPCGIMAYWLSKRLKKPYIITEHWSQIGRFFSRNIFFSGQGLKAYSNAGAVTVVSEFLKSKVAPFAPLNEKNILVIPNVIDESFFYFTPKQTHDNQVTFSAVATWGGPKRPEIFIEALNQVQLLTNKKIILKIGGTGNLLEKALKRNDLIISIEKLGAINKAKVAELLKESDFFIHATDTETFSVVVAEALLSGTPVIASNVAAIPLLVQNEKLGLLSENNITDWVTKITQGLSTNFDNRYIADFHKGRFSVQQIGNEFNLLYKNVLSKRPL